MIRPVNKTAIRRGIGAFELLLILPILLLLLLAGVQFSATLSAEDKIAEASRQGARVAAAYGDENAIRDAIRNVLGAQIYSKATITIKYVESDDVSVSALSVVVMVSVPTKEVAPGYLKVIGINEDDEPIIGHTVMRMEAVK